VFVVALKSDTLPVIFDDRHIRISGRRCRARARRC
jgi:hypothetical protein